MNLFAIMYRPGQIAGRDLRVDETMKDWRAIQRHIFEHFFDSHDPFAVSIEVQRSAHARISAIGAHDVPGPNQPRAGAILQWDYNRILQSCAGDKLGCRHPFNAGADAAVQESLIQEAHSPDTEFIVRTRQIQPTPRRRVQSDIAHRWPQTVFGQREIFERAPDKYSGGMNRPIERGFAVYERNPVIAFSEQAGKLQTRQTGADDRDIISFHLRREHSVPF